MLPSDIQNLVAQTFNRYRPSLPNNETAYTRREYLVDALYTSLTTPGSVPLVFGYSGVGKTSLVTEVTNRLLGPERLNAPFARKVVLQGRRLAGGIPRAIAIALGIDAKAQRFDLSDEEIAQALEERETLLVVENLEYALDKPDEIQNLLDLAKLMADQYDNFPHAKLVIVLAASAEGLQDIIGAYRRPLRLLEVEPWTVHDLIAVVKDGSMKCKIGFHDAVVNEVAAISCGIPATVHVLANLVCMETIRSGRLARDVATRNDLNFVLGQSRFNELIRELMQGIDYISHLTSQTLCARAIIALAANTFGVIGEESAINALQKYWSRSAITSSLHRLSSTGTIIRKSKDAPWNYHVTELIASTASLLMIRREVRDARKRDRSESLYNDLIAERLGFGRLSTSSSSSRPGPRQLLREDQLDEIAPEIIRNAVRFLFDEGSNILRERRERRASVEPTRLDTDVADVDEELSGDSVGSVDEALNAMIDRNALDVRRGEIQDLLELKEVYIKNYRLARRQYAIYTSADVTPRVLHALEEAEEGVANTMYQLKTELDAIYQKRLSIPELDS